MSGAPLSPRSDVSHVVCADRCLIAAALVPFAGECDPYAPVSVRLSRFGSRVDIYLPASQGTWLRSSIGYRGESVLPTSVERDGAEARLH